MAHPLKYVDLCVADPDPLLYSGTSGLAEAMTVAAHAAYDTPGIFHGLWESCELLRSGLTRFFEWNYRPVAERYVGPALVLGACVAILEEERGRVRANRSSRDAALCLQNVAFDYQKLLNRALPKVSLGDPDARQRKRAAFLCIYAGYEFVPTGTAVGIFQRLGLLPPARP